MTGLQKFADPKNDVAFKKVFSENNIEGLKNFIECIIPHVQYFPFAQKIDSITFLDKEQMPTLFQGKRSLCDLKVVDENKNTYIIEMQRKNEEDCLQRIQYYCAQAFVDQIEKGISHVNTNPIITISIMERSCFEKDVPCISYRPFKETATNKQLLLSQSHVSIELPKLEKSNLTRDTLECLLMFRDAERTKDFPNLKNKCVLNVYTKLERHKWSTDELKAYTDAKVLDDGKK